MLSFEMSVCLDSIGDPIAINRREHASIRGYTRTLWASPLGAQFSDAASRRHRLEDARLRIAYRQRVLAGVGDA